MRAEREGEGESRERESGTYTGLAAVYVNLALALLLRQVHNAEIAGCGDHVVGDGLWEQAGHVAQDGDGAQLKPEHHKHGRDGEHAHEVLG